MALTDKKYTRLFSTGGSDDDNVSSDLKNKFKADFDANNYLKLPNMNGTLSPILHILQNLTEEIDYLRTEISNNKDKTGISTAQVNAITANTAKTGITSQQATDISDNKTATSDNRTEAKRLGGLIDTNTRSTTNNASTITALVTNKLEVMPNLNGSNQQRLTCGVTEKRGAYMLNFTYQDTDKATGKILIKTGSIQLT